MSEHTLSSDHVIELPMLPLRDVVVFPHMVIPLFVGRGKSIKAIEAAMEKDRKVVLVAQKVANQDELTAQNLYTVGTMANILQMLKLPDDTIKVLVEGQQRVDLLDTNMEASLFTAQVQLMQSLTGDNASELEAFRRNLLFVFDQYAKLNKKLSSDISNAIAGIDDAERLADAVAAHLPLKLEDKQAVLGLPQIQARLEFLYQKIEAEVEILGVDRKIRQNVKKQMEKSQRDFYLSEQMKAIQKEMGEGEEGADIEILEKKIKDAHLPAAALKKVMAELKKLKLMSPMSAEASVVRNYIDLVIALPWSKKTKIKKNLPQAEQVLENDHWGLEKVKERILEYLAVQQRVSKIKAPILCLVGPPGVGKTSLGQSIAKATGRKYVRMALGGVHDEAEIRGHRRTYIGSMPGRIINGLSKVNSRNPLFLLDEVDKMGHDFRGDPYNALLEVLDPEQNHTFSDHYIELDFNLSEVMFVATSNSMNIPPALLDRMEVIRLSGYTEDEKVNIALKYLIPKQMENNGVKIKELEIKADAVLDIVRYYTREAGVRALEREISKICRKVVKGIQLKKYTGKVRVSSSDLDTFLGVRKFSFGLAEKSNQVGQVVGLAWTEVGGDLLTIETAVVAGKGGVKRITGSLGEVMKESVEAAYTVVHSRASQLGINADRFEKQELHVHVPDGATPKDGPSAGAAMTAAMVSSLTGIPVRCDVAMTGEITLRGEVTKIGGLKEKLLAALRGGIKTVLIPEENTKDLAEIPDNIKNGLEIRPVRWIDEVLALALERKPVPLTEDTVLPAVVAPAAFKAQKTTRAGRAPRSKATLKH